MRLRVCFGIILVGVTALPQLVRSDIDGSTVELKRKPEPPAPGNAREPDDPQP